MTAHQPMTSVLIVDDDPIVCEVTKAYFEKSGVERISIAHNGRDALDVVDGHQGALDFILLDLKMPIMDGVQFLRHMHGRDYQGTIGIVSGEGAAILSLAMDLARKCGLKVVGPLSKPFGAEGLKSLIVTRDSLLPARNGESASLTASELEEALVRQQIKAHYQPQIDVETRAITGVEALARWHHPERGIVAPDMFVPLAEDNGLMPMLTEQMIENVISDIDDLNRVNPHLSMSINLGAAILNDTAFPDALALKIDQSGQDRARFTLELTESKMVDDSVDSMEVLARLDLAGFELSLDDFGTQFSNIEQLTKYPFKELKIDRSFVQSAATDMRSRATVESCVSLGRQLGMRVVAEGVETNEDVCFLSSLGVDLLQGYKIAKPMPIDALEAWAVSYRQQTAEVS